MFVLLAISDINRAGIAERVSCCARGQRTVLFPKRLIFLFVCSDLSRVCNIISFGINSRQTEGMFFSLYPKNAIRLLLVLTHTDRSLMSIRQRFEIAFHALHEGLADRSTPDQVVGTRAIEALTNDQLAAPVRLVEILSRPLPLLDKFGSSRRPVDSTARGVAAGGLAHWAVYVQVDVNHSFLIELFNNGCKFHVGTTREDCVGEFVAEAGQRPEQCRTVMRTSIKSPVRLSSFDRPGLVTVQVARDYVYQNRVLLIFPIFPVSGFIPRFLCSLC